MRSCVVRVTDTDLVRITDDPLATFQAKMLMDLTTHQRKDFKQTETEKMNYKNINSEAIEISQWLKAGSALSMDLSCQQSCQATSNSL